MFTLSMIAQFEKCFRRLAAAPGQQYELCAGADPEISFGGGGTRRRRRRGVRGVRRGCPPPHRGRGMGKGLCPLPRNFFQYCIMKWPVSVDSDVLHVLLIVVTDT